MITEWDGLARGTHLFPLFMNFTRDDLFLLACQNL